MPGGNGSLPSGLGMTDHRYGGVPPCAAIPKATGTAIEMSANASFPTLKGSGALSATGRKKSFWTVPLVPLTWMVNAHGPGAVGVPESVPAVNDNPDGNAPPAIVATQ